MERLRSLRRRVSRRRRSHSPSSSNGSISSSSLGSSFADVSSLSNSQDHLRASTLSTTAPTSDPTFSGLLDSEASANMEAGVYRNGTEGQAGIRPLPSAAPDAVPDPSTTTRTDPTLPDFNQSSQQHAGVEYALPGTSIVLPSSDNNNDDDNFKDTGLAVGSSSNLRRKRQIMPTRRSWVILAAASGTFAALNGTFAKLTTADRTDAIASALGRQFGMSDAFLNPLFRGIFFLLNLLSNAIMWALFTKALTAHSSTTRVSLINTSANFLITACLGFAIFGELLPPAWFGGAALLVLGTVIIGRDRKVDNNQEGMHEEVNVGAEGVEKPTVAINGAETIPLLAGDEDEGVRADGEGA